ncbi:LysR substrate-binding domain-containing protein [Arthrobacter sp. B6]|uniref:LysR substrate-binding domain-containing protein n=1 Tax=Arthrobacter sp. B6 TaxID=1570137 RepID=UPI00082BD04D|nr:LysR substrate-binding domain-containing protein [Arthrobacter sp. B6]
MARYTLRQLEIFIAVAEHGSMSAAADALLVSQSAVAGAVNALEHAFGAQLTIRRKAHGVALTAAGRYVLDRAKGLLNAASDLELHAADAGAELRGSLTLGCYRTLAPTVLAALIDDYSRLYPFVELDFFVGPQSEVQSGLASGTLDLAIAYDLSLPNGLVSQRLFDAVPAIVIAADHPLAAHPALGLADVADEPMILLDVNPSRENTMMMFSSAGIEPNIRFRTLDYEVTRSLVGRGMGYAILIQQPASNQSYEGRPLAVRPIEPTVRNVPVSIIWPAAIRPSRSVGAMMTLAAQLYGKPAKG